MANKIPTPAECLALLEEYKTPQNIIAHCRKVCEVALRVVDILENRNVCVNRELVLAAALLHDICKMQPEHVKLGADLIKKLGYPKVAEVMKTHGLEYIDEPEFIPQTIEQKVVFYADKRVAHDRMVTVGERFSDLKKRYAESVHVKNGNLQKEEVITKQIEAELLQGAVI